ncbi:hypothetical protein ACF0H5_019518 [Mactra antiquata]
MDRPLYVQIRKLRKKLRQIEHLEAIDRDLNDEEVSKCMKKEEIRDELLELLVAYNSQQTSDTDLDTSITTSVNTADLSTSTPVEVQEKIIDTDDVNPIINDDNGVTINGTDDVLVDSTEKSEQTSNANVNNSNGVKTQEEQIKSTSPSKKLTTSNNPKQKSETPPTKKNKSKTGERTKSDKWCNISFSVSMLESHNDLITSVDCIDGLMVSGSRDTTVKIWNLETLKELKSLGSHTGTVTDVIILSYKHVKDIGDGDLIEENDYLVLSGSNDCSLKVWSANTGELLRSIYTYNPITKIAFYVEKSLVATASDGGKLELWDINTKECICSESAHSDSITGLCVLNGRLYTSCSLESEIKVYELRDDKLHCIFASDSVHNISGHNVILRHVRSLGVKGENIFYGDDGVNLKILSWKQGLLNKCVNHREEFGMTDAICCHGDIMITSAYDLDNGHGYINVFDISTNEPVYMTTIDDTEARRILDISCYKNRKDLVTIVTAGLDLTVWKQETKVRNEENCVSSSYIQQLAQFAQDSDIESDVEFTDTEDEEGDAIDVCGVRRESKGGASTSWLSWCTLT